MRKITILVLHLGYGGVEQYISSLCKMLDNNYDIEIISTYKLANKPAFFFSDKIKISYLINCGPNKEELKLAIKNKNIFKIIKEGFISLKILFLKKYKNIKYIKNMDSYYIITTRDFHNRLVSKYAKDNIIKIATEHNFHNDNKKYINSVIDSIKKYDFLVVPSLNLKNFYENKIGNIKCIYIPNTIDNIPDKISNLTTSNLISIGRLSPEKGQLEMIDVVSIVKKKIPNIKLFLIGDGPMKNELKKYINKLNLNDNVILTGFLSRNEINKYLLNSSLFILPSITESFGLVLIEAMSYGIPCIAFDSSDGAKTLLSSNRGILIKNRNKVQMAEKIIDLLNNKKLMHQYGVLGNEYAKTFLIDSIKDNWLDLLKGN